MCGTDAILVHFRALTWFTLASSSTATTATTTTTTTATRKNSSAHILLFVLLYHPARHLYICVAFLKDLVCCTAKNSHQSSFVSKDSPHTAGGRPWSVVLVKCHVLSPTIPRCRSQTPESPRPVSVVSDTSSRPRSPNLAEYRPSPSLARFSPLHQWIGKPDATSPRPSARPFTPTYRTPPAPKLPFTLSLPPEWTYPYTAYGLRIPRQRCEPDYQPTLATTASQVRGA